MKEAALTGEPGTIPLYKANVAQSTQESLCKRGRERGLVAFMQQLEPSSSSPR
jgi:hypothetical protein